MKERIKFFTILAIISIEKKIIKSSSKKFNIKLKLKLILYLSKKKSKAIVNLDDKRDSVDKLRSKIFI